MTEPLVVRDRSLIRVALVQATQRRSPVTAAYLCQLLIEDGICTGIPHARMELTKAVKTGIIARVGKGVYARPAYPVQIVETRLLKDAVVDYVTQHPGSGIRPIWAAMIAQGLVEHTDNGRVMVYAALARACADGDLRSIKERGRRLRWVPC